MCVDRLASSFCGSAGCPPTLDPWLEYAHWPHEPNGLLSASYSVCDNGTTWFTETDPFGESGTIWVFDAEGRLIFDGNYLKSVCGDPPPLDSGVMCSGCEIVREGGLEQVGSTLPSAGAGGESGAPASPVRLPVQASYCLVDSDGRLVMPSN